MPNTILNDPSAGNNAATYASQARPDKGDVDVWVAAHGGTGVVSGCATSVGSGVLGGGTTISVASGSLLLGAVAATIGSTSLGVTAADATNARTDLVVYDSSLATPSCVVIAGTPAATPVWPTFNPATQVVLATVAVPATATSISSTNITDKRVILRAPFSGRQTASHTTASLANNAEEQSTIILAKSYRLLSISTSVAARVRLYDRAAKQTADASRAVGTSPTGDSGVVFDYVTTAGVLSADLTPQVIGSSMESSPSSSIPLTVDNLSGSTGTVTVTFTYAVLE